MAACNLKSVGKFHADADDRMGRSVWRRWDNAHLKSLSPSRLEIKTCKFRPPTVSDGERWSRRSTEHERISRDDYGVKG